MEQIKKKLEELEALVEKHPISIPVVELADFLNINADGLKAALMRHNTPFGFAYQKNDGGYRVYVVPTVPFYLWYTQTNGQMVLSTDANGVWMPK